MQLEGKAEDEQLKQYSYLEFLVCPSLLHRVLRTSDQQTTKNLWFSYLSHLQQLLNNSQISQDSLTGKMGSVFKCLLIISEYYLPQPQELIDLQVDSNLIPFILQ